MIINRKSLSFVLYLMVFFSLIASVFNWIHSFFTVRSFGKFNKNEDNTPKKAGIFDDVKTLEVKTKDEAILTEQKNILSVVMFIKRMRCKVLVWQRQRWQCFQMGKVVLWKTSNGLMFSNDSKLSLCSCLCFQNAFNRRLNCCVNSSRFSCCHKRTEQ